MLFNSLAYGVFLTVVFSVYWLLPHKYRWVLLLAASYYFYMNWNVKYVLLIFMVTAVSYAAARLLEKEERRARRKAVLTGAVLACLGVLVYFKYFVFLSNSVISVLNRFSLKLHPVTMKIMLPVGISFYTFQTMSYVLDVYRGKVKPEHHFGIYATFISFFPQLVAGPIERTSNLLPQIKSKKTFDYEQASYGLKLMAWGFFKKLAIADVVAQHVDMAYTALPTRTGFDFALAVFFFTIQIYCDFSGYSDIAIGSAKLLGIDLMTNFKSPYFSKRVREFWTRWHISLSTWFRDYLYIPLGGNRCSQMRTNINLIITFLVSGLWHGANWTFVIWGGINGAVQIAENTCDKLCGGGKHNRLFSLVSTLAVFIFCNFAWVFFRAESLSDAAYVIIHMFDGISDPLRYINTTLSLNKIELLSILGTIGILAIYDYASLKTDVIVWISQRPLVVRWTVYLLLVMMTVYRLKVGSVTEFIYFQF